MGLSGSGRGRARCKWGVRLLSAALVVVLAAAPVGADSSVSQGDVPPAPTGLGGTVTWDRADLIWDDPGDPAVIGYQVLRRDRALQRAGVFSVLVDDTGDAVTEFTDNTVEPGRSYVYRVKARSATGMSDRSHWFRADTPEAPGPGVRGLAAASEPEYEIVWSSVLSVADLQGGASGYTRFTRSVGSLSSDEFVVDGGSVGVSAVIDHGGLVLGLSRELSRDFVFRVGGSEFVGSDSLEQVLAAAGRYWWPSAPMGWTAGDEVELSIAMGGSGAVTGRPPAPPSAYFANVPPSHDGETQFDVDLVFDEANLAVDAKMLKDHALAAVGAEIIAVRKYSPGSASRWTVTLQPEGASGAVVSLPAATDCVLAAAVCSSDGRALRADAQAVVAGPGMDAIPEDYLLPDLVSDPPVFDYGVHEVLTGGQRRLVLRFDGYVTNLGDGPVDLSGNPQLVDPADPTSHDVWQRVKTASGEWFKLAQPPVRYETADGHNHFHLMDIVAYSLWSSDGVTLVAPGAKVGFCLADSEALPDRHPDPGPATYSDVDNQNCMANEPNATSLEMGVTEGWRDIYDGDLTFQWIDVSDVSPGRYRLGVEADPYNILIESDETNNGVALSDDVSVVRGYVAKSKVFTAEPDTTPQIRLSANSYRNPGRIAFRIVSHPSHGTIATGRNYTVVQGGNSYRAFLNRTVTYTPDPGFSGVDTFEFVAFDSTSPDFPTSPVVATATIDMTAAEVVVSIVDAPASIVAGTTTSLRAQVTGAAAGVSWAVEGVDGGNSTVGTIDADGTYAAPAAVPASGSVVVRATSTTAPSAFAETAITITEAPNTAPSVTFPGNQSFSVGDSVDVHVVATDAQGDQLTWTVDTLPAGLDLVRSTGRIVGNPTIPGTSQSVITVSDGDLSASVTISWNISLQSTVSGDNNGDDDLPEDADSVREGAIDLGDITGTGGLSNGVVRVTRSSINGVDDGVDYFRFTLTGYTFIDLSLRRQDYDADMFIENADGIVLEPFNSTSDGTATEMIFVTLPAGHYFIRVEAQEPGLNAYTLRYKVFEGHADDAYEIDG